MAYPTGTLSFADAGILRLFVSATWYADAVDFGSPDLTVGNLRARIYVGVSGSYSYSQMIDKFNTSTFVDVSYPGGSVTWDVGVEEIDYVHGSSGVRVGLKEIRVTWELVKK